MLQAVPPVYSSGLILSPFFRDVGQPRDMFKWFGIVFGTAGTAMRCRYDLATENLALRQQLAVMKDQCPRPNLTDTDRCFWVLLSRIWSELACRTSHRSGGNRRSLAPSGFSLLLALEKPPEGRKNSIRTVALPIMRC